MTRRVQWAIGAAIVAVIATVLAVVAVVERSNPTGSGLPGNAPTSTAPAPANTGTCSLVGLSADLGAQYQVAITNGTGALENVTGWVVLFLDASGVQTGSDTEPGNGYIDGKPDIVLNDEIGAGQTATSTVEPHNAIPAATSTCQLAQVNAQ